MLPSLFLVELVFFNDKKDPISIRVRSCLFILTLLFIFAGLFFSIQQNYLEFLSKPIDTRPFSIGERILTQSRILLFYLGLIFYPSPTRLSIDHDVTISTSLLDPWTTLVSILFISILILFSLLRLNKNTLFSFSILFFFINHIVESSIIPLELIFEHRNYLPSFFLFLPIAVGIHFLFKHYSTSHRVIYLLILIFIPSLLTSIGWATFLRNKTWTSEESLWMDALHKAPHKARPLLKLGEIYGWRKEKTSKNMARALQYNKMALTAYSPRLTFKAATIGNIGAIYFNYHIYSKAVQYYKESLAINPAFINSRFGLAQTLTLQGKFPQALEQVNMLLSNSSQVQFLNLKGMILLWMKQYGEGADCIRRAMLNSTRKHNQFYNLGVALSKEGHVHRAEWFLKAALKNSPNDYRILFSLIENSKRANDNISASIFARQLVKQYSILFIQDTLEKTITDYTAPPINVEIIRPEILDEIDKYIKK